MNPFAQLHFFPATVTVILYGMMVVVCWPVIAGSLTHAAHRYVALSVLHLFALPVFVFSLFIPPLFAWSLIPATAAAYPLIQLLAMLLYVMVMAGQAIVLGYHYFRIHKSIRTASARVPGWVQRLYRQAVPEGIVTGVRLHAGIPAAAAWGVTRPLILLPLQYLSQLSELQLKAVILHEWMHIKRADFLFNVFHQLVNIILWFSPAQKHIYNLLVLERECAVDDEVIHQIEPADYSETLYRCAKFGALGNHLVPAITTNPLKYRIERLMAGNKPRIKQISIKLFLFQLLFLCAVLLIQSVKLVEQKLMVYEVPGSAIKSLPYTIAEPAEKTFSKVNSQGLIHRSGSTMNNISQKPSGAETEKKVPEEMEVHFAAYQMENPSASDKKSHLPDSTLDKSFILISLAASSVSDSSDVFKKVIIQVDKQYLKRARL